MEHLSAREHSTGESASPFYAWHPIIHTEPDKTRLEETQGERRALPLWHSGGTTKCVHILNLYRAFLLIGTPRIIVK